jgi:hypothetical protein
MRVILWEVMIMAYLRGYLMMETLKGAVFTVTTMEDWAAATSRTKKKKMMMRLAIKLMINLLTLIIRSIWISPLLTNKSSD